jgi:pSer/pThr/pTyr-binding forkhead associated (FHA) protein
MHQAAPYGQVPQQPTTTFQPTGMQPTVMQPTVMQSGGFALLALDGPLAGQRFGVVQPIDVGREASAIPLGFDSGVSRRHVRLSADIGGVVVQDLGSTNGTFVNGQRVQQATAPVGTLIKVGATTFRVEAG